MKCPNFSLKKKKKNQNVAAEVVIGTSRVNHTTRNTAGHSSGGQGNQDI